MTDCTSSEGARGPGVLAPNPSASIVAISDLHYGISRIGDAAVEAVARRVCAEGGDALVIVGDIGSSVESLAACLALFAGFEGARAAVPGNHDVWCTGTTHDSWTLHEQVVPEVFRQHGFHALHQQPLELASVTLVGSMGWYDYSFRDDIGVALEWYRAKTLPGRAEPIWNDARHCDFPLDDGELTALLVERLRAQLAAAPGGKPIVAALHHLPIKALLVHPRALVPLRWRFMNAFLGASGFGELLASDSRVRSVVCGHIHLAHRVRSRGIDWSTIGSDYEHKAVLTVEVAAAERLDAYEGAARTTSPAPRAGSR